MATRSGEKVGWIGGWFGAFCWLPALAVLWIVQGKAWAGTAALALTAAGVVFVLVLAPWRRPTVPYWKLMLPGYLVFYVGLVLALLAFEAGVRETLMILPAMTVMLLPFVTIGRRRWDAGRPEG